MVSVTPLISSLSSASLLHVAVIMDGNGRWARSRGMPRTFGHREGMKAVNRVVDCASQLGITHLTMFGFSSENWSRPKEEISELMNILRYYLQREVIGLHKNNVCIRMLGDRDRMTADIVSLINKAEQLTARNTGLSLNIALSYGGRCEITKAVRRIANAVADGKLSPSAIDNDIINSSLDTKGIPDPDLLIRTSGEHRISNFLLWQIAYAELVFTDVLWPDFGKRHLIKALEEFSRRCRRYGQTTT
ncbi:di-trans,poly-cis-decaprenylcistransferase [Candidatus Endolissoclinum faulkneri L5]|uniref:Isoprenyl transferase n=1 Tax=Candidatus Endolissoclinum faulkneri L5 TaxID=1401328 RepID=V9TSY6_9PROT|nr:isoprenyl transferase [Candidatus Endolissoclinum faulkneri]AHC73681.1 di-trans,poly-cis-decaprenylcistransferase [Candidatus Endolissoclinum faulkneri L5]